MPLASHRFCACLIAFAFTLAGLALPARAQAAAVSNTPTVYPGGSYHSVTPARLLDTRTGLGGSRGLVRRATVKVTGIDGVPTTGVAAVAVNLTVTKPTGNGYAVAFAAESTRPEVSNLNYLRGQTVADMAVVAVGASGQITVAASAVSQVLVDITGYFTTADAASENGLFHSLTPARLMDTRKHLGTTAPPAGKTTILDVAGHGGVPRNGVIAVVLNLTETASTAGGYVTAFPAGTPRPGTSTVNVVHGRTIANRAIVSLSPGGRISLFNAAGTTQLVADVTGYFTSSGRGEFYLPIAPRRAFDGAGHQGQVLTYSAVSGDEMPLLDSLDPTAAVVLTITAVPEDDHQAGYLSVLHSRTTKTATSDVNFTGHQPVANLSLASVDSAGAVSISASAETEVLVDIFGVFVAEPQDPTPAGMWATVSENQTLSTAAPTGVTAIAEAAFADDFFYLTGDGRVWESQDIGRTSRLAVVPGLPKITGFTQAGRAVFALGENGTVWSLAYQLNGILKRDRAQVLGLPEVVSVGAGAGVAFATTASGQVWAWGDNGSGQFGNGTTVSSDKPVRDPALDGLHSFTGADTLMVGLDRAGRVYQWGSIQNSGKPPAAGPVLLNSGCSASTLSGGDAMVFAQCTGGSVEWLGTNRGLYPSIPQGLPTGSTVIGGQSGLALSPAGTVWTFDYRGWTQVPWLTHITVIGGGGGNPFYEAAG